eukprot:1058-Pyramimonas_sp.AAC.1
MRQTDASDVCESTPVIISQKTESFCEDDSHNTNRFAGLARLTDRVQISGFDRRTRLNILH